MQEGANQGPGGYQDADQHQVSESAEGGLVRGINFKTVGQTIEKQAIGISTEN